MGFYLGAIRPVVQTLAASYFDSKHGHSPDKNLTCVSGLSMGDIRELCYHGLSVSMIHNYLICNTKRCQPDT